jgi:NAD(P)-dependent dehydrogenase (short-subunit alcohol dehydrogenase family)
MCQKQTFPFAAGPIAKKTIKASTSDILGMTSLLRTLRPASARPLTAYVAAKHGMLGLTQVTALKAAITCNAICPGFVYASLVDAQIEARRKPRGIRASNIGEVLLAR